MIRSWQLLIGGVLILSGCDFWPQPVDVPEIQANRTLQILVGDTLTVETDYQLEQIQFLDESGSLELLTMTTNSFTVAGRVAGLERISARGVMGDAVVTETFFASVLSGIPVQVFLDETSRVDLQDVFSTEALELADTTLLDPEPTGLVSLALQESDHILGITGHLPGQVELTILLLDSTETMLESAILILNSSIRHMVLVEDFTNADCINCPTAAAVIDALLEEYPENLAVIRYHLNWPDPIEPMYLYNPQDALARWTAYGNFINLPTVFIDGADAGQAFDVGLWAASVQERITGDTGIHIHTDSLTVGSDSMRVTFSLTPYMDLADRDLQVFTAVTEDSVEHDGEYEDLHLQVMRDLQNTADLDLSQAVQFQHVLRSPPDIAMDPARFQIVIFVQDRSSREILQASRKYLE